MHTPVCEGRRAACCAAEGEQAPRCVCVGLLNTQAATPLEAARKKYATIGAGIDEILLARRVSVRKGHKRIEISTIGAGFDEIPLARRLGLLLVLCRVMSTTPPGAYYYYSSSYYYYYYYHHRYYYYYYYCCYLLMRMYLLWLWSCLFPSCCWLCLLVAPRHRCRRRRRHRRDVPRGGATETPHLSPITPMPSICHFHDSLWFPMPPSRSLDSRCSMPNAERCFLRLHRGLRNARMHRCTDSESINGCFSALCPKDALHRSKPNGRQNPS